MTNNEHKLTNERIIEIADETRTAESRDGDYILPISFARAIEAEVRADVERWAASHAGVAAVPGEQSKLVDALLRAVRVDFIEHARAFGEKAFADYFERWITTDKIRDSVPMYATNEVSCRDAVRALEAALATPSTAAVRAAALEEAAKLCKEAGAWRLAIDICALINTPAADGGNGGE